MRELRPSKPAAFASPNGERVGDALERLANERDVSRRRRAHAADFPSTAKVMGAMQGYVLRRICAEEKERDPKLGGVLLLCSAADALHARIVGDVLAVFQHPAALDLPASAGIVGTV